MLREEVRKREVDSKLEEVFNKYDFDKNGLLDRQEYKRYVEKEY